LEILNVMMPGDGNLLPVGALKLTRTKKKSCGKAVKDKAAEASENGYKKAG
jgi:hypothetical protein